MAIQETRQIPIELVERISEQKGEPDWMRQKRLRALERFESLPVPRWWHTDVRDLKLEGVQSYEPFLESGPDELQGKLLERARQTSETSGLMVQCNAQTSYRRLSEELQAQGVIFTDLDTALREHEDLVRKYFMTDCVSMDENKFVALHAALWSGGVFLYVPRDVEIKLPFAARHLLGSDGGALFEHTLIVTEPGSRLIFVESIESEESSISKLHDSVVEIIPGEGSQIIYAATQALDEKTINFTLRRGVLSRDAEIRWFVSEMGSKLTRSFNQCILKESGSRAEMKTIFFGARKQHLDIECSTLHIGDHSWSDILTKGALADKAVSVYNAVTDIKSGAMGTKTFQTENTLLLSDEAKSNAIPGLYIEENELEGAGHAATVGKVDADQLFYLRSRGIPETEATKMIVKGFLDDMLKSMPLDELREEISDLIDRKLASA